MKKTLLTFITTLCISIVSFSQSEFGILAGGGASTFYMTNYAEYLIHAHDHKTYTFLPMGAGQVGFYYNQSLTPQFGVGVELLLKSMGALYVIQEFTNGDRSSNYDGVDNFIYLSVPLYARYTEPGGDFYIAAGVANNFFVYKPYPFWRFERFYIINNEVELNRYDLMAQFTLGGRLLPRLMIECTFNHSITRFDRKNNLFALHEKYNHKLYNRAIYISLKYPLLSWQ